MWNYQGDNDYYRNYKRDEELERFISKLSKTSRSRTANALRWHKIDKMETLVYWATNKQREMLKWQNFGKKGLGEILDLLGIESQTVREYIAYLEKRGYEVRKVVFHQYGELLK